MVTFGTTDRAGRYDAKSIAEVEAIPGGIAHGMMGERWERRLPPEKEEDAPGEEETKGNNGRDLPRKIEGFRSIGQAKVRSIRAEFGYGGGLFRFGPYLYLSDLNECMLAFFLNRSLADKVKAIHIYANEYKLGEYASSELSVDSPFREFEPDLIFTPDELSDEWVRIMRDLAPFRIRFSEMTPVRLFEPVEAINSGAKQ